MRKRQVAIIYRNPLFAQGIECLLQADPRLSVTSVEADDPTADEELRRLDPHVLLVEREGDGTVLDAVPLDLLGPEGRSLLVILGLRDAEMHMFYNRRVTVATPDSLLDAVLGAVR